MGRRLRAGVLDRRIFIQDHTQTPNPTFGDLEDSPFTIGNFWAQVEHLSGREMAEAQQTVGEVTHRFTIRWRDDLKDTMTITYDGRVYDVVDIDEESYGREEAVVILAKAKKT